MTRRYLLLGCAVCLLACEATRKTEHVAGEVSSAELVDAASSGEPDAANSLPEDAAQRHDDAASQDEKDASAALEEPASAPAELLELCDGSNELRLVWQKKDDIQAITQPFQMPYGGPAIFVVDGHCRFYASGGPAAGYVTGTLSAEQGSELGRELAFTEVSRGGAPSFYPRSSPVDFPVEFITTREGIVSCSCGCPAEAPKAVADAMLQNGSRWLERLLELGKPWPASVVSAVAVPLTGRETAVDGGPIEWPLSRSMDEVPNLKLSSSADRRWSLGPYARIDDAGEIAALRALRRPDAAGNSVATSGVRVTDGTAIFRLYVRDELPEGVARALDAFLEHAAKLPRTP